MAIPISTTTITIKGRRPQSDVDPEAEGYDTPQPAPANIATNVRASITLPTGKRPAEADEIDGYTLRCDLFPGSLNRYDVVVDESDGQEFEVVWVAESRPEAYALQHIKARLQLTKGISAGNESGGFIDE